MCQPLFACQVLDRDRQMRLIIRYWRQRVCERDGVGRVGPFAEREVDVVSVYFLKRATNYSNNKNKIRVANFETSVNLGLRPWTMGNPNLCAVLCVSSNTGNSSMVSVGAYLTPYTNIHALQPSDFRCQMLDWPIDGRKNTTHNTWPPPPSHSSADRARSDVAEAPHF